MYLFYAQTHTHKRRFKTFSGGEGGPLGGNRTRVRDRNIVQRSRWCVLYLDYDLDFGSYFL